MKVKSCGCGKTCCLLETLVYLCSRTCDCADKQDFQRGSLVLAAGRHEIKLTTRYEPDEVFVSLESVDAQVCGGDIDMAGTSLLADGFILYADIKSSECRIKWCAKFDNKWCCTEETHGNHS